MKRIFDNVFKPYLFPILILFGGAYLKAGENLKIVTDFFSKSSYGFINFFSSQLFLWEVVIYFFIAYLFIKLLKRFFASKSKREGKMLRAIKKSPHEYPISIIDSNDRFIFKFDPVITNNDYFLNNFRAYCHNCSSKGIRMSENGFDQFRCNCGKKVDFMLCQDVRSSVITMLESNE
jgi:hypothetical protein